MTSINDFKIQSKVQLLLLSTSIPVFVVFMTFITISTSSSLRNHSLVIAILYFLISILFVIGFLYSYIFFIIKDERIYLQRLLFQLINIKPEMSFPSQKIPLSHIELSLLSGEPSFGYSIQNIKLKTDKGDYKSVTLITNKENLIRELKEQKLLSE